MIEYFHQADDPYSHLAAQVLAPLAQRYGVEVRPWLVPPPDDSAAPERARLTAYARRDAPRLAAAYGLRFPDHAAPPAADAVRLAQRAIAAALTAPDFAARTVAVGEALWAGDTAGLAASAPVAADATDVLAEGEARRRELGHYLGAMFHFDGEWFWGVSRRGSPRKGATAAGPIRRWRPTVRCGSARGRPARRPASRCGSRSAAPIRGSRFRACAGSLPTTARR
jgi:2-hydroxychromene-2-carboxylate isomerase